MVYLNLIACRVFSSNLWFRPNRCARFFFPAVRNSLLDNLFLQIDFSRKRGRNISDNANKERNDARDDQGIAYLNAVRERNGPPVFSSNSRIASSADRQSLSQFRIKVIISITDQRINDITNSNVLHNITYTDRHAAILCNIGGVLFQTLSVIHTVPKLSCLFFFEQTTLQRCNRLLPGYSNFDRKYYASPATEYSTR